MLNASPTNLSTTGSSAEEEALMTGCTIEPTSVLKLNLLVNLSWDFPSKPVQKRDVKAIYQEGTSLLENLFPPCFNEIRNWVHK